MSIHLGRQGFKEGDNKVSPRPPSLSTVYAALCKKNPSMCGNSTQTLYVCAAAVWRAHKVCVLGQGRGAEKVRAVGERWGERVRLSRCLTPYFDFGQYFDDEEELPT